MKKVLIVAAMFLTAGTAFAAGEARAPKVTACEVFDEFTTSSGAKMGMCEPAREGGKPRVIRSYVVASVVNPVTGKATRVLVGYP